MHFATELLVKVGKPGSYKEYQPAIDYLNEPINRSITEVVV